MAKLATTPSRCLCLMLAMLVWTSSALFTIHELDHLTGHDDDEICLQCLAATGLDQPLVAYLPPITTFFPQYHSQIRFNPISLAERPHSVFARGPPLSHL